MSRGLCGVLALTLLCPAHLHAQGVLEQARSGRTSAPPPAPAPSPSPGPSATDQRLPNSSSWTSGSDAQALGYLAAIGVVVGAIAATSPIWLPAVVMHDGQDKPAYFPSYPYALDYSGFLHPDHNGTGPTEGRQAVEGDPDYLKWWSVRASLEDGNDFRGLNRLGGRLVFDTTSRLGLQTSWNHVYESLGGGHSDQTVLGDAYVTYRFAQCEWGQMHIGAGGRMQTDRYTTRAGFSGLYSGDLFLYEPLILSALVDFGHLREHFAVHTRASVGLSFRWCEVFTGYDFQRIGPVNIQGPMLGLRLWF